MNVDCVFMSTSIVFCFDSDSDESVEKDCVQETRDETSQETRQETKKESLSLIHQVSYMIQPVIGLPASHHPAEADNVNR